MWHMSNYDWMLFLTSPMAFPVVGTHYLVFTEPNAVAPRPWLLSK